MRVALGRFGSYVANRPLRLAVLVAALVEPFALVARGDASPSPVPSKSAAAPVFVGPSGWQHAQGTGDGLGTWLRPGDTNYTENVVVRSKGGFASLDALLRAEVSYIASLPDQFGYAPTDTTVCGNHPAKYLSYTYTSPTDLPVTSEVVIAVFGTTAYIANYSKAIGQDVDAAAERSLTTLCGRAAAHGSERDASDARPGTHRAIRGAVSVK